MSDTYIALNRTEKLLFRYIQDDNIVGFKDVYSRGLFNENACNSQGLNYISECVRRGATKIADHLLSINSDLMNIKDKAGRLPLSYLSPLRDNESMVMIFKAHAFDFTKSFGKKGNILHIVAPTCKKELFDELVKAGADPNESHEIFGTPDKTAMKWKNPSLSQYIENAYINKKQSEFDFD